VKDRFEALPSDAQAAILEKHRDQDIWDDWYNCIFEDFKTDMGEIGIEVERMMFSGFYSQGDGACFEGKVANWPKFLVSINAHTRWHHGDVHNGLRFGCEHSGRYYHRHSVSYDEDFCAVNPYDECTVRYYAMEILLEECVNDSETLFEQCKEAFRDHMLDLYNSLEEEHEYLTSDEHILERLIETEELEGAIDEYLEGTEEGTEEDLAEV